jgi:hypothetical protein
MVIVSSSWDPKLTPPTVPRSKSCRCFLAFTLLHVWIGATLRLLSAPATVLVAFRLSHVSLLRATMQTSLVILSTAGSATPVVRLYWFAQHAHCPVELAKMLGRLCFPSPVHFKSFAPLRHTSPGTSATLVHVQSTAVVRVPSAGTHAPWSWTWKGPATRGSR